VSGLKLEVSFAMIGNLFDMNCSKFWVDMELIREIIGFRRIRCFD
jgi:hypothetical protein